MARPFSFFAGLGLVAAAHAVNPVHDATTNFSPFLLNNAFGPSLMLGQYFTSDAAQKIRVPVSYQHPLGRASWIGIGIQSRWYEEPNNVRHLVFGAQYVVSPTVSFQLDALWGVANYAGDGLTASGNYRLELFPALHILTHARVGFLDALVWHPDYAVVSAGVTPQVIVHEKVRMECETLLADQLPGMGDTFSLDLGPGLRIQVLRTLAIRAGAVFGVLGPVKTSPRIQLTEQIAL